MTTVDYAGEHCKQLLENKGAGFQKLKPHLVSCDAVLFLVDSHELCHKATSWAEWSKGQMKNLFGWLSNVLVTTHDPHKPFFIACSRADLVSSDLIEKRIKEIQSFFTDDKLSPDVFSLSVFGKNKAGHSTETNDIDQNNYLSADYSDKQLHSLPTIPELLRDIQERHSTTKRFQWLKVIIIVVAVVFGLALGLNEVLDGAAFSIEALEEDVEEVSFKELELAVVDLEDYPGFKADASGKYQIYQLLEYCHSEAKPSEAENLRNSIREMVQK